MSETNNSINPPTPSGREYYVKAKQIVVSGKDNIAASSDANYGPWNSQSEYLEWLRSISSDPNAIPPSGTPIAVWQEDGTTKKYTWQKPYEADGYWELSDPGDTAISGAVYFNTVEAMKASTTLNMGDIVMTKGFYSVGDGGGATYRIVSAPASNATYQPNNFDLLLLANGLCADIVIENGKVGFLQIGGRRHSKSAFPNQPVAVYENNDVHETLLRLDGKTVYDNKEALEAYATLLKRKDEGIELIVPVGHYFMSPTFLGNSGRGVMITGCHAQGDFYNMTSFHAIKRLQDYVLSVSGQRVLNHKDYTQYGKDNISLKNICFDGTIGGREEQTYRLYAKVALVCVGANMSYFDGLFFRNVLGAMVIGCTQETHFGLINIRGCGGFYSGFLINPIRFITVTGSYSADKFSARVWGVSSTDWASFTTTRNCSALYFHYFNCEGVFGSVIHAELGANFTHSEINNVQWEATMKNLPAPNNQYYPNLMDFRYNPTGEDFGWRIGETAALSDTPASYNYSNEKIIRCGFVSGDLYDIVIHCVTVTWGTDGQIWGYNGTLYRVVQSAIVCIGSTTNDQADSESGPYTNVNLITYNIRESQSFRALYMGISSTGVYKSTYPFSCCKPVVRTTKEFVVKSGCPMPRITFVDLPVSNRIYCAMAGPANNDAGCLYESAASSPAHIVRNGGAFSFIYDSSKHYRCYGRFTQTSGVIKVYNGDTVYGNLDSKYSDGAYHVQDLALENLSIPNGTRVFITVTRGSWAIEHIDFYDNALVYGEPSVQWTGRKWIDDQGVIHTCS